MYVLEEYAESSLPSKKQAIERALHLSRHFETKWNFTKEFPGGVKTYTEWISDNFWTARVSEHPDVSYEEMYATIYKNHTENESQYIKLIEWAKTLKPSANGEWDSRLVHYKFPFPLSNRDMAIWITEEETIPGEQFVVVTLPRQLETEYTNGYYVAVEIVTRLESGGVKWAMGTTSDAGGWVPQFMQRSKIPAAVAEDVPQYLKWLKSRTK